MATLEYYHLRQQYNTHRCIACNYDHRVRRSCNDDAPSYLIPCLCKPDKLAARTVSSSAC